MENLTYRSVQGGKNAWKDEKSYLLLGKAQKSTLEKREKTLYPGRPVPEREDYLGHYFI